jgi:hypothetical protein
MNEKPGLEPGFFCSTSCWRLDGLRVAPGDGTWCVPDTEAEFTMCYMMLIQHDEVALAEAPPSLWGDYAAGKVN